MEFNSRYTALITIKTAKIFKRFRVRESFFITRKIVSDFGMVAISGGFRINSEYFGEIVRGFEDLICKLSS